MIKWVNTSKILRRMSSNAKHYKNLNYNHCFTQSFHLLAQVLIVILPYIFGISEYLWQVLLNLLPGQLSRVTSNTVDLLTLRQPTTRKSDSLLRWTMQRNWGKQQNRNIKGTIKDRNGKDLTEVEEIKGGWQEYTELYKKRSSWPG